MRGGRALRLRLILPCVEPEGIECPEGCVYEGCDGRRFRLQQVVEKGLRDAQYTGVTARRYECLRCGRTFRVYPQGVARDQSSLRVKGLAVMLYLLGLSYGAVSLALGVYLCKSQVYAAVGARAKAASRLRRVADELDLQHQVCKSHIQRNTEALLESLSEAMAQGDDGSLSAISLSCEQAFLDLERLRELVQHRQPEEASVLEALSLRYQGASPPRQGERASVAYRLRMLFLDRWNMWRRLTRCRTWQGPQGEAIDGTNLPASSACLGRAIGWWTKERYRTMRGYKRSLNAVNVSRLLAWCGSYLDQGGAPLATVIA